MNLYIMHPKTNLSLALVKKSMSFGLVFGEHVGDPVNHKLLNSSSNKVIYGSAVRPANDLHPNMHLLTDLG